MIEYNAKNARLWSIMGINPSIWSVGFADTAAEEENLAVLTADLERYSGLQRVFKEHPEMTYNVGIAEQNMVGIGAGLAMEGFQVYMTTYAPFMSLRCADQIRHLMGNMKLNMKAIGSAAGLSAGLSGTALLAINDMALMRSIPNMTVLSPADCVEAVKMMEALRWVPTPVYMRFCGTTRLPMVYTGDYDFEIGKAVILKKGSEIALVATGTTVVAEAMKAAKLIEERLGIQVSVVNMHTIKPVDEACIDALAATHRMIVTLEEHNVIGGLGSAVAECLTKNGKAVKQVFIGVEEKNYVAGSRAYMLRQCGLEAALIAERICTERTT